MFLISTIDFQPSFIIMAAEKLNFRENMKVLAYANSQKI